MTVMKESVLVVDDDLGFLQVIKNILQRQGYEVETVSSAGEAVSRTQLRFYNVAILDISLPDMEGTVLLSKLLEKHPDMIVMMLTGHASLENAVESLNRGAFAYLEKPLDPRQLTSAMNRGLEKQRLVFENRSLLEELERRNREIGVLLSVSRAILQSADLSQALEAALRQVAQALGMNACWVHLSTDGKLVLKGQQGLPPEITAQLGCLKADEEMLSQVFGGQPVVGEIKAQRDSGLACLARTGLRWCALFPLINQEEILGVMGAASCSSNGLAQRQLELLSAIAREVSLAVHNARLYEEACNARALRELDSLRTQFLANVSHELRTPLAAIKGFATSLLQPDVTFDEETWRDFLQSIDREADRLNRLIGELLLMSRLESGALEVRRERHRLADIIGSIKDRLHTLTAKHQLRIQVSDDLTVLADSERIGEVFTNLVENAVKYSPEGSSITIEAHSNGREVYISVIDEGIGIPPELHEKVFERFYQVNPTGQVSGTGLGLSICQGIVEAHGGRIWVESRPGEGAKFTFTLPGGDRS